MWELDHKESWAQKNWCFLIVVLEETSRGSNQSIFFSSFFFYCSGFCHTLKWNSHGFTCVPHPDPPSHRPLHPIPLGLPSAPGLNACLMHPTWAKPVNLKGNQPWIFIGRTGAGAEAPIFWPPDAKSRHIGQDPDARKDWRQKEKGVTEDEMVK